MRMLNNYIGVAVKKDTETESGILMGEANTDRPQRGVVKYENRDIDTHDSIFLMCKIGDEVIFGGWYDPVEIDGEDIYFVKEEDIKAIIDES